MLWCVVLWKLHPVLACSHQLHFVGRWPSAELATHAERSQHRGLLQAWPLLKASDAPGSHPYSDRWFQGDFVHCRGIDGSFYWEQWIITGVKASLQKV